MEHVVFFPAHDGSPAFRRLGSLEEAVRLVEHLRNVENVSEVSVHSLAEVPLNFKPYYKVEVPAGEAAAAAAPPAPAPVEPAAPTAPPVEAAPAAAPIAVAPDPTPVVAMAPEAAPAVEQVAVVPEQAEAPAETPDDETAAARESGAASLGFFAS